MFHGRAQFPASVLALALVLPLLAGCAGGLALTPISSTQNKPSNVAIYFKVQTASGEPVGGLAAEQFRIYEDGSIVSQYESKQTILNPEVAVSHYTLLLVDMSGSVADSGNREAVVEAATTFTDRVEKSQKVAIYAFDGSEELHPIVPFTESTGSTKAGVQKLGSFKPQDPSTNLNGAVVHGLDELDRALAHSEHPLRFGTLVVFTDGTDHAARVAAEEMQKKVRESRYDIFAIGLGAEIKESQLRLIGKNGTTMAADKEAVVKAFDSIGARIEATTKSFYLLSYCSPARAGRHEVRIEADAKLGNVDETGSLRSDFDATGFTANCDPNTPPNFDVTKGDALAPPKPPAVVVRSPGAAQVAKPAAPKEPAKAPAKEEFSP
jgi:von Willebrand factor type A domain